MSKIVIIRIKGQIGFKTTIKDTLQMLRLYKKNTCAIVENNKVNLGMVEKIKEQVTWGEINEDTFKKLLLKRGRTAGNKLLTEEYLKEKAKSGLDEFTKDFFESKKTLKDVPGLKNFFRLNPPIGGFERKGIKIQYSLGGALGYRKEKINDLVVKML